MFAKNALRSLIGLLVIVGICMPLRSAAQSMYRVHVDYIDSQRFPVVDAYVSVADSQGFLVKNLLDRDFSLSEDGTPVTNFKLTAVQNTKQPLAVALLIDTSTGMNTLPLPTPLQTAVNAAKTFIDALQPQDVVAEIPFSDTPVVVTDFSQDRNALKRSLDSLQPGNKAAMFDAISNAVVLLKNRSERRVIVLITDGRDTRSHITIGDAISEANSAAVQIYPIGFGSVNIAQMSKLASGTGGLAAFPQGPSALQAAFTQFLQTLREQYLIEYNSAFRADGRTHSLKVQATVQGSQASTAADFVAQPGEVKVTLPYQDGQTVGGNVLFKPVVVAPAPTIRLDVSLDGAPLAAVSAEPFEYLWKSMTSSPGSHVFIITATDQAGNSGATTIHLDVEPPITAKIIAPSADAALQGLTKITAQVTTLAGNQVASVQIAVDGQSQSTLTAPPYAVTWDASSSAAGKHSIRLTAFDINGFSAQDEISVYVQPIDLVPWLIGVGIVVLAAIVVPLALKARKRKRGASAVPGGSVGRAQLLEIAGDHPNQIWPLGVTELRLGRKRDENDIPLKGLAASRRHAVIRFENGQYTIEGLSVDNPVVVNNQAIYRPRVLQSGDVIKLGETTLRYEKS